jgi:dTDP-4-amino-4,6-dideoxygalactose transaminase
VVCTNDEGQAQLLRQLWEKLPQAYARDSGLALIRSLMIRLVTHPRGWWLAARAGSQRLGERPESWGYRVGRLSPLQSRIGPAQLAELDGLNRLRLENGRQLATRLGGLSFVQVPELTGEAEPIYLRLPVLAETAECRERLYKRLWSANTGVGRLYRQPVPALFPPLEGGACPGAARVAECLLTLPTHYYLRQDDIDLMVAVIGG